MCQFGDEDLSSILFGSIPRRDDLCYLLGTINLSESNAANISNKAYQCQIFKCRCLIFTVSEVIASPVLGAVQNIHIITSKMFYESGKLNFHLEKMNIKVTDSELLSNAVYEACLRYTILARLAPSWNQVDKYLVRGRDFLISSSPLDAVKLDIVINDIDMHIALWPLRVRLPQVCTQDLQSTSFSSPLSWDLTSNNMTVHVLPSLNKANVLMVSGHIPQNSLFKSYKELKRHWKNSYGYRLPDSDEGIAYVTVKFGRWFSESLTYPIMCVRARRPVFLRQPDPQRLLLDILADLHAKVPAICGHPFGIDAQVRYAMPKLNVISEVLFPCNLTEVKPIRNVKTEDEYKEDSNLNKQVVSQCSQLVSQYTQSQYSRAVSQKEKKMAIGSHSPPPFLPRLSQLVSPTPIKPVFVPTFKHKLRPAPTLHNYTSAQEGVQGEEPHSQTVTVRPMFGGLPMKPMFGLAQSSSTSEKLLSNQLKRKRLNPCPLFSSPKPLFSIRGEKTLLNFPEATCKKSRNKPQIQPGVDVKALAHTRGGLDKVNTTTLIAYLRGEGVPCKVKDKKGDLVNKVLAHLKLPPAAPESPTQRSSRPYLSSSQQISDDLLEI